MTPTDLGRLAPPPELISWVNRVDPSEAIQRQGFKISQDRWHEILKSEDLDPGMISSDHVSRSDLFAMAERAASDPRAAERLLWNSVAWGLGRKMRLVRKRVASFAVDRERLSDALVEAAAMSRTAPEAAYSVLQPGRPLIKYLGPAFFTKYLYFAGAGAPDHPSLILDSRIAATLHRLGWESLASAGGWPPSTYGRYCDLVARWSEQCDSPRRDLIERYLFDAVSS